MYLIFDTETTGLPKNWKLDYTHTDNWPRVVQIAWQIHDDFGNLVEHKDYLIKPEGFNIPFEAESVHGISTQLAEKQGETCDFVLKQFKEACDKVDFIIGHNINFDINVMSSEYYRKTPQSPFLQDKPLIDTCSNKTANLCQIPGGRGGGYKWPKLTELHVKLFGHTFAEAHNATADVEATARVFLELIRIGIFADNELHKEQGYVESYIEKNKVPFQPIGLDHVNLKRASNNLKAAASEIVSSTPTTKKDLAQFKDIPFVHLHNHTQFTILQATTTYKDLVDLAVKNNMPAVALTDNGNMMGAFHFEKYISEVNEKIQNEKEEAESKGEAYHKTPILPIIGCEFNVCKDRLDKTQQDNGYQIVMLAKNKKGYHNLIKMASIAYTEGKYYVPRIDKSVIERYKEDLIVLSGNLYGEIPNLVLTIGEKQAEEALLWWKEQFGEDFYLELIRHHQEDENHVNEILIQFSKKHHIKIVATNNTFYQTKEDAKNQDILLCINEGALQSTPIGKGRGFRFGFPNDNYYFKTTEEMQELFADIPEALTTIPEILSKIEPYQLAQDTLLPAYEIPKEFQDSKDLEDGGKRGENNYLRHMTYEGAKRRYGEPLSKEVTERLEFELETIEKTGYPGYFLIVQDFCQAAREMDIAVGPGRGSAAGSAVAYCIGITNIDPIKYDLLFERFLNPDRVSMPDIDTDFEDNGRAKIIDWVIQKYGANQVSQIITWGTMAAKSAIRDAARVLDLPLYEADRLAKLIPGNLSLHQIFNLNDDDLRSKLGDKQEEIAKVQELKNILKNNDKPSEVLKAAINIEGTIRNTGIHACGVIIAPDDLTNYVPVALAKDSDMWCTQFENSVVESAGLLKMDFLGLKTLTLIKDSIANIKQTHGIVIDPDQIPIEDEKTYELFQRGETVGIFQYESPGMQKYMRELKPTVFADLIAMNALYRPGPIQYIPTFIRRKNGDEPIEYDLDVAEEYLKETYGVTVYQEQVMLLSQKIANFTKGEADVLRKAMGKKKLKVLEKMKPQFINQAHEQNGHPISVLEKIWEDWKHFASYAFNKSHSTCYAWVAYQTAYMKANYPAEYMAAVLSNNMNDIKQVSFYMEECVRMGLTVLGPDVNESAFNFTVNKKGEIRFGMGAVKGLGEGPVFEIIKERNQNGGFTSIFDFIKRINLRSCNKKAIESLSYSGGFDSFGNVLRSQLFTEEASGRSFIESLIRYGTNYQESINSAQTSLFGEGSSVDMPEPSLPKVDPWPTLYRLNKEKEVVGMFISGHPLEDYKLEIKSFCNGNVEMLKHPARHEHQEVVFAAIVTEAAERMSKNNSLYGIMTIEDYNDTHQLFLFKENYQRYKHFFQPNLLIAIRGKFEIPRYRKEPEFNVLSIERLQDLKDKMANQIKISLSDKMVDQLNINKMNTLFTQHPGKCKLTFEIFDPLDEKMQIKMNSSNIRLDANKDLVNELERMGMQVSLCK